MGKDAFAKTVVAAGGFLFLCAALGLALAQPNQSGAAPPAPAKSALAPPGKSAAAPDLLAGLTLTDEQKAKIDRIREETKTRLAAVTNDKKLDPAAADAFLRGYQRIEDGKILEVLTPEQQKEVHNRVAAWRAKAGKTQYPMRRLQDQSKQ